MIVRIYAELIRKGMKTLSDVPEKLREAVEKEFKKQRAVGNE